jgi:hypothetical protein
MLEIDHGQEPLEELWAAAATRVEMSDAMKTQFFSVAGGTPLFFDNRRTYHRYQMRGKAVLKRGEAMLGIFTKDVSRQGVAFLSPVPLLPKEPVRLRVPKAELNLEVTRCRRIDSACFECGAKFSLQKSNS